jgi:hypothetical protein
MTHSSPVPSAYARPTPAHALPGLGALSARIKAIIVDALALILAWKPGLAACLGKALVRELPALVGVPFPERTLTPQEQARARQ